MTHVFLEREWPAPEARSVLAGFFEDARAMGCLRMHRVRWEESFVASDERKLFCHFSAPDAESLRLAMRDAAVDAGMAWTGTIHEAQDVSDADLQNANVVVIRGFDRPADLAELQAVEDRNAHCLDVHRVRFVRTFLSSDARRMACLYRAPDAESVRIAQRQATMPFESVWAFRRVSPDSI